MALIFPFDTTLKGHVEEVEVNISDLDFPIFAFPKGSFFVSELYGVVKGTQKIVRPGLDFKVLSLNETLKFNDTNATLDKNLRENYVRNAILWRGRADIGTIVWHVPYAGGEDSTKPGQYNNYIEDLFNQARVAGTVNLYTTPYQAWGGFIDPKNEQFVSGSNIYQKFFDYYEDMNDRGGLGWGKVQLGVMALADVVTSGGDPMELQAYYDWIRHNESEFNEYKSEKFKDLNEQIANLDGKRIGIDQFVYSNKSYNHYDKQFFLEHNNVILRGLDPNETGFQLNPISTKRKDIGFYGLADWGTNIDLRATRLSQRKATAAETQIFKMRVVQLDTPNPSNPRQINWRVECANKNLVKPGKDYWLYIISKRLGRVIQQANVSTLAYNATTNFIQGSFSYPDQYTEYGDDIIFAYVLDRSTMQGDFNEVKRLRYTSYHRRYGYTLAVNSRGIVLSDGEIISKNPTMDGYEENKIGTGNIEVTVTRQFSDYVETNYLGLSRLTDEVATTLQTLTWAVGETKKVVNLYLDAAMFNENQTVLIQLLRFTGNYLNSVNQLAAVVMGYRNTSNINEAYIKLLTNKEASEQTIFIDEDMSYYLSVQYARNVDYNRITPKLKLTEYRLDSTGAGTVVNSKGALGEPIFVDHGKVLYPIQFNGFNNGVITPVTVELIDDAASFSTNRINVFIENNELNTTGPGSFSLLGTSTTPVDGGVNVTFRLKPATNGVLPDGSAFNITPNNSEVKIANAPVYVSNVLQFTLFYPTKISGIATQIAVSYRIASGNISVANVPYTLTATFGDYIRFYGMSGQQLVYPALNEPFRIMYVTTGGKAIQSVNVTLDETYANRSSGLKFGGDAVLNANGSYTITKPNVLMTANKSVQVSVDGWLTITAIDPMVNTGNALADMGLFYLKADIKYTDNSTSSNVTPVTVPLGLLDVKFYKMDGVELGNDVPINSSFVVTFTSSVVDLTQVTGVAAVAAGLSVASFSHDATRNIVTAVVQVGPSALGNDKVLFFRLLGTPTTDLVYRKRFNFINT